MWTLRTARVTAVVACRWLLLAAWPLHVLFASLLAITVVLGLVTEQSTIVVASLTLAAHYAVGLNGSFALHELGHLVVLARARGVTAITLERSLWRTSISPHGRLGDRDAALAALAGPGACVGVGVFLWLSAPSLQLHGWYLAHVVFLIPSFADGRTLWSAAHRGAADAARRRRERRGNR